MRIFFLKNVKKTVGLEQIDGWHPSGTAARITLIIFGNKIV